MAEDLQTPERSRDQLLAAMSAAGAAVTGLAEALRVPEGRDPAEAWSLGHGENVPLEEEVFEPLLDAVRLAAHAVGYPEPLHRIGMAAERFLQGDD